MEEEEEQQHQQPQQQAVSDDSSQQQETTTTTTRMEEGVVDGGGDGEATTTTHQQHNNNGGSDDDHHNSINSSSSSGGSSVETATTTTTTMDGNGYDENGCGGGESGITITTTTAPPSLLQQQQPQHEGDDEDEIGEEAFAKYGRGSSCSNRSGGGVDDNDAVDCSLGDYHNQQHPPSNLSLLLPIPSPATNTKHNHPTTTTATTPEPPQQHQSSPWYSLATTSFAATTAEDSKAYRAYIQSIDKCLKNFEYSIEWPDLISALSKLNKVIASYNATIATQQQQQQSTSNTKNSPSPQPHQQPQQPPLPPPPLPRTTLITKRLSQCLHPNLPSGVHLKTLETFDLIFKGFRPFNYIHLEADLFSFTSGLLPLWSYAAISVKPKLLSIYENHLVELGERIRPALAGIMLSLFNGLVDDGVEQDIKIRIQTLLSSLQSTNPSTYHPTLLSLISSHPSIHLPILTHIIQINYTPPPTTLMALISSPNTLVQRNALDLLLKSNQFNDTVDNSNNNSTTTQVTLTKTVLQSLLKRDMSLTRRVFNFIEPRPRSQLIQAIHSLIQDPQTDGHSLTRILSSLLDNPNIQILDQILAPVVKYLMKCEYSTSIAFLSTINSGYLSSHFTAYLFEAVGGCGGDGGVGGCHGDTQLEELENRVIVFNYIVKLRLFEMDWASFFANFLSGDDDGGGGGHGNNCTAIMEDDAKLRVILQMVRLHYNSHHDSFLPFYNSFMGQYFRLEEYDRLAGATASTAAADVSEWFSLPNSSHGDRNNPIATNTFTSSCFEYICELMQRSDPSTNLTSQKYIILSACTPTRYTDSSIRTFISFQTLLQPLLHQQTQATFLIFKHCYDNNKPLLNSLKYPEKYLLSELKSDRELREVIRLDLSRSPLVVLKLVDPGTMGGSCYRRFVAKEFVRGSPGLVLGAVLKYLEFHPYQQQQPSPGLGDDEGEDGEVDELRGRGEDGSSSHFKQFKYCSGSSYSNNRAKSESNLLLDGCGSGGGVDSGDGGSGSSGRMAHANSVRNLNNTKRSSSSSSSCYYDSARVSTLLEKLEFVLDVNEEGFLKSIDLVVLLSKLTVLATVQNCSHGEESGTDDDEDVVTLEIQTRALRLIGRIVKEGAGIVAKAGEEEDGVVVAGSGCSQYSFVYDSLLAYLNGGSVTPQQQHRGAATTMMRKRSKELELLWELAAVDVICNFFKFDLENYSLALVVQKCLSGGGGGSSSNIITTTTATTYATTTTSESRIRELEESVHIRWLKGIGSELGSLKRHFNALVLISFTNVCRNLLEEKGWSDYYWEESLAFLNVLIRFVLGGGGGSSGLVGDGSSSSGSGGGFLSSLFGGSSSKDSVVDNEREALRTAMLGKVDLVLKICCRWWGRRKGGMFGSNSSVMSRSCGLAELVRYLGDHHEGEVMSGILKCFDVSGLEYVCKEMLGVGGGKVCGGICSASSNNSNNNNSNNNEKVLEGINFLVRYLKIENSRSPSSLDVGGVVSICKLGQSCRHTLLLVTEYLMRSGGGASGGSSSNKVGMKELQDLVVRTIEMGVEKREFWVLESYVPGIFDLVWGGGGGGGGGSFGSDAVGSAGGGDVDSLCSTSTAATIMTTATTATSSSVIGGMSTISGGSSSASNASARDQKVIVNTVHGVVVAVLVAVKGSLTGSSYTTSSSKQQPYHHDSNNSTTTTTHSNNNYTSALKVMEQISHHSYLRKAWKKEIFDLITSEPTFFYFTPECLAIWKVVVDNLFTQDRSTFSELITRLTQTAQLSTTTTLSTIIFSSRDSELCETRACLLKRLSFVIHSSEKDQYAKYITNIQEKIAEALKIGSGGGGGGVGSGSSSSSLSSGDYQLGGGGSSISNGLLSVSNSVFLCFRIMVLKFNANILVSLWPIIVHEVVMVLNSLQSHLDELLTAFHHNNAILIAQQQAQAASGTTEPQQPPSGGEELPKQQQQQPQQPSPLLLSLYLQTLKLLNFLFTIPSSDSQIPHFQLYKWAFTDVVAGSGFSGGCGNGDDKLLLFIPYISKLINSAQVIYPNSMTTSTSNNSNRCSSNNSNNQQTSTYPPLRIKGVRNVEELCGTMAFLDVIVPEGEWEVVDFCDGDSGGGADREDSEDDNTDL